MYAASLEKTGNVDCRPDGGFVNGPLTATIDPGGDEGAFGQVFEHQLKGDPLH